jgi:hypothetical protein
MYNIANVSFFCHFHWHRLHPFYRGRDAASHLRSLRNVLRCYSLYNFDLGYCQVSILQCTAQYIRGTYEFVFKCLRVKTLSINQYQCLLQDKSAVSSVHSLLHPLMGYV